MSNGFQAGDYVLVLETQEVGLIEDVFENPGVLRVIVNGQHREFPINSGEIARLNSSEVWALDQIFRQAATIIDLYVDDEEFYDPKYNEEGEIYYSRLATTVVRALALPSLIRELSYLRARVKELENEITQRDYQ